MPAVNRCTRTQRPLTTLLAFHLRRPIIFGQFCANTLIVYTLFVSRIQLGLFLVPELCGGYIYSGYPVCVKDTFILILGSVYRKPILCSLFVSVCIFMRLRTLRHGLHSLHFRSSDRFTNEGLCFVPERNANIYCCKTCQRCNRPG